MPGQALPDDPAVLHAVIELTPRIRSAGEEIEAARRLPPEIAEMMRAAGVFGMAVPRAWGGPEVDPMTQFRVIEVLGMAEGSVGWCAMIGCDTGYVTGFLDQDVARAMYPDFSVATGAAATPTGRAVAVPEGYRVSGRFPFVSGCHHCEWLWLGCIVAENGAPRVDENGVPETRQCFISVSKCEILDTWYTTGLRGTGSNDIAVRDHFVPVEQTFSFQDPNLVKRPGPLYAFPLIFLAKQTAPALGVARYAIDSVITAASGKSARRYMVGKRIETPKMLCDDVFVQESVARADAILAAARAYVFELIEDIWATLRGGGGLSPLQLARFSTVHAYVTEACVDAVQLMYKVSGGTAVYEEGALARCLRDVQTMNQHVASSLRTWEAGGRQLLGLEPLRLYL
jgi:indole-3-acetate monooxygenase